MEKKKKRYKLTTIKIKTTTTTTPTKDMYRIFCTLYCIIYLENLNKSVIYSTGTHDFI